jgi:hypothetical protein
MKKITLLVASVLLIGNVAKASEINFTDDANANRFSFDEPISFDERGIEFFVFPNGDFDFNTRPDDSQGDYFFKGAGKRGNDKVTNRGAVNYGTLIEFDSFGRVRRVGNTFINYDAHDRVNRIGSVYMRYNRFALTQVGGLQIVYNHFGEIVDMIGEVKGRRNQGFIYPHYGPTTACNTNSNYDYSYSYNNSNDYYYYKTDGTKARIEDKKKEEK